MSDKKDIFLTEEEKLRLRLQMSPTERFRLLMRLIKISRKMKESRIIYPKS